jgi:hypothetical protein
MEFGVGGFHWTVPDDFNFGSFGSNIIPTLHALEIGRHLFYNTAYPTKIAT